VLNMLDSIIDVLLYFLLLAFKITNKKISKFFCRQLKDKANI
jgi:hypothetical protein